MPGYFRSRIRKSLADANLQSALDANAVKRLQVRKIAFESLPNAQEARQRARHVRAEVVEHLDQFLDQFIQQAEANGMQVHRAADASQAVDLVLQITRQQDARLVAKAKTMVSEEIHLNPALEKAGLKVVETDLGEYIVQLRGEPPSHIITPAVHLRRQDVGRLFADQLGLPYTEDISLMTNAARQVLRQVFLDADVGISGVNFAVAETGTLCVVTNEGNGRMVTTLPRTHIALMGIERLVPSMGDLALMLSLLPRSATGQKLSVYTSLLNAPRRNDDPDGPQERHVILVDNYRSAVRASGLCEILYCIRCGACLNACPVFREIGGHAYVGIHGNSSPYPGPMGSVVSPALFGQPEFGHLARASSLCGACREVCPVDIDLPGLLLKVRAGVGGNVVSRPPTPNPPALLKLGLNFYAMAATSHWRFSIVQRLAGIFGRLATMLHPADPWIRMPAITAWGLSRDMLRPAVKPFHARYKNVLTTAESHEPAIDVSHTPLGVGIASANNLPENFASLKDTFATELLALGGKFAACELHEVAGTVLDLLNRHEIGEILAWDASRLPNGLLETISAAGIQVRHPSTETLRLDSHVRAGLSGASAGIADSGSLLLLNAPGQPLSVSLLPEIHIALLHESDIFQHLDTVLEREDVAHASAGVMVTGPSRTADIEMTLTIGVHGPGELHVIYIKSS